MRLQKRNHFVDTPDVIANSCFHCWRHAQGLVNPAKIVVHVMERNGVLQVFEFLREGIRQAREPAHRHSHGQILSLNIAGRNVVVIGCAANNRLASAHANCGTVTSFRRFWRTAVNLLQHSKINFAAKAIFDRAQIRAMPVSRQLNAICQPIFQIVHEVIRASRVTLPDKPARHEFAVRIKRNPRPHVPRALRFVLCRAILFFGINKRPDFVTLQALALQIAKNLVLIFRAGAAKIAEQFHNRRAMDACHAGDSAQRITLDQGRNYSRPFFSSQLVHDSNMLERSSIVNKKIKNFAKKLQLTNAPFPTHSCFNENKRNECGEGGIPTRGTRKRPPDYKSGTLKRSVTSPNRFASEKAGDVSDHRLFIFSKSFFRVLLLKGGNQPPFPPAIASKTFITAQV